MNECFTKKPCFLSERSFHRHMLLGGSSFIKLCQDIFCRYRESKKVYSLKDSEIFPPLFKACATAQLVNAGTSAHADAIKMSIDSYTSTGNSIMNFYIKVGMMDCALNLFDNMVSRDSVSWNAVIHGFLSQGDIKLGLDLFREARVCGFVPNASTLVSVVQACWRLKTLLEGEVLHGIIVKGGFAADISVQNSLLSLYGRSQDLLSAQKLFDHMQKRDVISWSSLISGYAKSGGAVTALQLFQKMLLEIGVELDGLALVSVLQACCVVGNFIHGRSVHGHVIQRGFEADMFIGNSLVDMYSKCHDITSAYIVFTLMPKTNLVSWNSFLSGLVENEKLMEALLLFDSMKKAKINGDAYTAVILFQACKRLGLEALCRSIHSMIIKGQVESNDFVLNSLLDAYTKCGLIKLALKLFWRMPSRDVISWSTMISGFSHCGEARKAVAFFVQMRSAQETPNSVTLLSLLDACSILSDLKLSKAVHSVAVKSSLSKDSSVSTALLDAYAKCGDVHLSRKVFETVAEKNILSWNSMIGALGINGCAREALAVLEKMELQNVKPNGVTLLSVLSACSHGGLIQEGLLLFQRMSRDHSVKPSMEHYSCIVDMLSRAGHLKGGFEVIKRMPEEGVQAGAAAWGALVSACRRFGDCEFEQSAASHVVELEPLSSAGYVLSSSLHAKRGLQDETSRMRWLMKERGVRVVSGYSLVHVGHHANIFVSWDESHPSTEEIYSMVDLLHGCMQIYDDSDLFHEGILIWGIPCEIGSLVR